MRKQNRSCGILATAKSRYHFGAAKIINSKKSHQNADDDNKRGYSAEGYSLLTSALRPRLFGTSKNSKSISNVFSNSKNKLAYNLQLRFFRKKLAFTIPIISVTVLSIFSLFHNNANVSAVSATLSIPNGISINVDPSQNNGFAESNNEAISVSTGNFMGYTLIIRAKDDINGNSLVNTNNSNAKLNSITTNLTLDQYQGGNDNINTWGFKPSSINSSPNTTYMPGPTTSGITLARTNASSSSEENYSMAIAAKVDSNTIAGNYTNTFVMTATANEAKINIKYDTNGGSNGPKSPQVGDIGEDTDVIIDSTVPTIDNGKDFLGWCTKTPDEDGNCPGAVVQPGGEFPLCKCDLNLTLTAMWGTSYSPRKYTINYLSNVGSPNGMPATQTGTLGYPNFNVALNSNIPTLENYIFKGWCTSSTNNETCSGTSYQPGNSVLISTNGQTLNLYAMWQQAPNGSSCSHPGWSGTAKYYGGLCWMWRDLSGSYNWTQAQNACPSGWHLPSRGEFLKLINATNNGITLYPSGWLNENYWSSDEYDDLNAYYLYANSTNYTEIYTGPKTTNYYQVRCVANQN